MPVAARPPARISRYVVTYFGQPHPYLLYPRPRKRKERAGAVRASPPVSFFEGTWQNGHGVR